MRYIGNKENLLDKIYQVMQSKNVKGNSLFDFFAGTTSVSKFFKKLDYQIFSSDLMYFSYVLQKAYIENNEIAIFKNILKDLAFKKKSLFTTPLITVIEYLNALQPIEGFIYKNYTPAGSSELNQPRMYFNDENGKKIDAIRLKIEEWKENSLISENEYFILLACLIETVPFYANISGVYATFQKKWDTRALKKIILNPIEIINNKKNNFVFNADSVNLINSIETDIIYLDPPYNQRQYAPNYHLLETIAKYDNPKIYGVGGLRNYDNQKSKFCNSKTAIEELSTILKNAKYSSIIMSYNNEGILDKDSIIKLFENYGKVYFIEFDYLRFKSNDNGENKTKKIIKEQLYVLRKI